MLINCERCKASFELPDAKVQGKKLRFRCQGCGVPILVDGTNIEVSPAVAAPAVPAPAVPTPAAPTPAATTSPIAKPPLPASTSGIPRPGIPRPGGLSSSIPRPGAISNERGLGSLSSRPPNSPLGLNKPSALPAKAPAAAIPMPAAQLITKEDDEDETVSVSLDDLSADGVNLTPPELSDEIIPEEDEIQPISIFPESNDASNAVERPHSEELDTYRPTSASLDATDVAADQFSAPPPPVLPPESMRYGFEPASLGQNRPNFDEPFLEDATVVTQNFNDFNSPPDPDATAVGRLDPSDSEPPKEALPMSLSQGDFDIPRRMSGYDFDDVTVAVSSDELFKQASISSLNSEAPTPQPPALTPANALQAQQPLASRGVADETVKGQLSPETLNHLKQQSIASHPAPSVVIAPQNLLPDAADISRSAPKQGGKAAVVWLLLLLLLGGAAAAAWWWSQQAPTLH